MLSDLRAVPLASGSADVVIAVHVLEHFYQWEAVPLLQEWKRILKHGGRLIVEVPCLEKVLSYINACFQQGEPVWAQMSWWALYGDPRYQSPSMCHKWGYTKPMLQQALTDAGFQNVRYEKPKYHIPKRDMRMVGEA